MLIEIIIKMFGGIWGLKSLYFKCNNSLLKKIVCLIYEIALHRRGSWISLNAKFLSLPIFPHGILGIFISGGVSIGNNCVIFQQVTIGSNTLIDSLSLGSPQIGNNCYIGAGAKLIGNIKISDNVRIGANAVVIEDVPRNAVVVNGKPIVIIKNKALNNHSYHKKNGKWCFYEDNKAYFVTDTSDLNLLNTKFPDLS
jgi:serine O-acetyltransferase